VTVSPNALSRKTSPGARGLSSSTSWGCRRVTCSAVWLDIERRRGYGCEALGPPSLAPAMAYQNKRLRASICLIADGSDPTGRAVAIERSAWSAAHAANRPYQHIMTLELSIHRAFSGALDMAIRFPVEAGHVMMFARAVGDANPFLRGQNLLRQGLWKQAASSRLRPLRRPARSSDPECPLRPKIGKPWFGSGKAPSGLRCDGSQREPGGCTRRARFEYHRPIRPATSFTPPSSPARLGNAKVGAPAS